MKPYRIILTPLYGRNTAQRYVGSFLACRKAALKKAEKLDAAYIAASPRPLQPYARAHTVRGPAVCPCVKCS